jgi:hypothetical protein
MRGRACSVCLSPALRAVDDALVAGGKLIPVAKRFGLSKSALGRHRTACLAPQLAAAARLVSPTKEVRREVARAREIAGGDAPTLAEITSLKGLLARLARSLERLETAADGAAAVNAYASLAALSGQLHRGVEAAGRLQGLGASLADLGRPGFNISIIIPEGVRAPVPVQLAPEPIGLGEPEPEPDGLTVPDFRVTFDEEVDPPMS